MSSTGPPAAAEPDPSRTGGLSGPSSGNEYASGDAAAAPPTAAVEMSDLAASSRSNNHLSDPTSLNPSATTPLRDPGQPSSASATVAPAEPSTQAVPSIHTAAAQAGSREHLVESLQLEDSTLGHSTDSHARDLLTPSASNVPTATPAEQPKPEAAPVIQLTLLFTSGARHAFRFDDKYLAKRNIHPPKHDPYNVSVYTLKELIFREWRDDWESKPFSPSSIRLIHFGRLLDDKVALRECRFKADSPNVLHMTVRPQELVEEEDNKTSKQGAGRDRHGERSTGCRCTIL